MRPDVSFGSPRRKNGNARPKRKSLLTSKHAMPCERPVQSSQSPQNLVHAPEGGALIASGFTARAGRAGGARTSGLVSSGRTLVPHHSDYDWLILSQFRMGRSSGATRIWMLRATPG